MKYNQLIQTTHHIWTLNMSAPCSGIPDCTDTTKLCLSCIEPFVNPYPEEEDEVGGSEDDWPSSCSEDK